MYNAVADPYCYPGTSVLKNLPGLTSQSALDRFEAVATGRRFLEPIPGGRCSVRHFHAIHRHIFQDVYSWAGKKRITRISKPGSMFCYPEHIREEMRRLFADLEDGDCFRGLTNKEFSAKAAHFLADLNAIHAFRDGNGRTQLVFLFVLASHAGHQIEMKMLDPDPMLRAMIASFRGNEVPLAREIVRLIC